MTGPSRCATALALALAGCSASPGETGPVEPDAPALYVEAEGAAASLDYNPETPHARYARVLESSNRGLRVIAGERLLIDLQVALSGSNADPNVDVRFSLRSLLDESMRMSPGGSLNFSYEWTMPSGIVVREQQSCASPRPDDLELAPSESYERSWSRPLASYERLELTIGVCVRDEPSLPSEIELAVLTVERESGAPKLELTSVE